VEQQRPEIDGLSAVGVVVAAIVVAGIVAGRDGAIVVGTLLVVASIILSSRITSDTRPWQTKRALSPTEINLIDSLSPSASAATQSTMSATTAIIASPSPIEKFAPAVAGSFPDGGIHAPRERDEIAARLHAFPAINWRRIAIDSTVVDKIAASIVSIFFSWVLLTDLGNNPAGLFCDEAEIGIRARELLSWKLFHGHFLFFYHHFDYTNMGSLPLLTTAPFVLVLGLSDFSVRLASIVYAAAAIPFLVLFVRRIGWSFGEAGVIAFAASPVYIHFARINFGQSPSILCVAIGLYCYAIAKDETSWKWPAAAGSSIALSAYGNGAFYLAGPVILASLGIGEFVVNRFAYRRYRDLLFAGTAAIACWVPVLVRWKTDPNFMRRFHDKTGSEGSIVSVDRLHAIVENYGRYFSLDYLFFKGESGLPGGYVLRHSVPGAGELQYLLLPLILLGIVGVVTIADSKTRLFGSMGIALAMLYPIPDAIATPKTSPPYTVTAMATMFFVPILAALGAHRLITWLQGREISIILRPRISSGILLGLALAAGASFFTGPYANYPNVAAGYYGWQFGPRQAVDDFKKYRNDYDRYQMDGDFNEAYIFLDFYMHDDSVLRSKTMIGGLVLADLRDHELLAVRAEKYDALMESNDILRPYVKIKDIIYYPDGEIAMYVLDVGYGNYDGRPDAPY
jgi:hypothetical protein